MNDEEHSMHMFPVGDKKELTPLLVIAGIAHKRLALYRKDATKFTVLLGTVREMKIPIIKGVRALVTLYDDEKHEIIGIVDTQIKGVSLAFNMNALVVSLDDNKIGTYTIDCLCFDCDYARKDGEWRADISWPADKEEIKNHALKIIRAGDYKNTALANRCKTVPATITLTD